MQDRLTTKEYRALILSGSDKKKVSSSLVVNKTGDRISSQEYRKSLSPSGHSPQEPSFSTPKALRTSRAKSASLPASAPEKKKPAGDRFARVIESIEKAFPEGQITPGEQLSVTWAGMSLLSLNELLRADHRTSGMNKYRKACHELVASSAELLSGASGVRMFDGPVRLRIRRTGQKLIDTDGLYASFKFLIDGFRAAGFIPDDDPTTITAMTHLQMVGAPSIGIDFYLALSHPPKTIIESPFAGDTERNIRYAKACMLDSLKRGEAPLASHVLYASTNILRDELPEERRMGIEAGFAWMDGAERHAVYADLGITPGMREGVARAVAAGLQTEYRSLPDWKD